MCILINIMQKSSSVVVFLRDFPYTKLKRTEQRKGELQLGF